MKNTSTKFKGMTVNQGAAHVWEQLEGNEWLYAADPARGEYRGFAALGDFCDHNMLYPFADSHEAHELEAWTDFANEVAEEFNRQCVEKWDALEDKGDWHLCHSCDKIFNLDDEGQSKSCAGRTFTGELILCAGCIEKAKIEVMDLHFRNRDDAVQDDQLPDDVFAALTIWAKKQAK